MGAYYHGCYWRADWRYDDIWVVGMGKNRVFPDPGIRIIPLDPMGGDKTGGFPDDGCLHREGSHSHGGLVLTRTI